MGKGKYVRWMRGHVVVAARDHNWQKQQCDPFPKIHRRWQGRFEMKRCFHFAILWNGNGNTFVASLDMNAMVTGNAGGGWTCYGSALSPDPVQAKSQAEAF
jgi:hypothetical protein